MAKDEMDDCSMDDCSMAAPSYLCVVLCLCTVVNISPRFPARSAGHGGAPNLSMTSLSKSGQSR
jgi:hypothetical protein